MTYVDLVYDASKEVVKVVERIDGQRIYNEYPARHVFYFEDNHRGEYKSIFGHNLSKYECQDKKQFDRELRNVKNSRKTFESDIRPVFRAIEDHYLGTPQPILNIAFFDIETDWNKERGWAPVDDPFNPITAISVFQAWTHTNFTFVVAPKGLGKDEALAACAKFPNTVLCKNEAEVLDRFLTAIEDADVLSGWNSIGFDIPYTVRRTEMVLGADHTKRFCLWNMKPKKKIFKKFNKDNLTFEIFGRVHLDYLDLYMKHAGIRQQSYKLDFIGEHEVGQNKTPYEGTLDQLYNEDFEKFIEYNRQDCNLLYLMDQKLKYIELANTVAHVNGVLLPTTMGTVQLVEQSINLETHRLGMIIPDRNFLEDNQDELDEIPSWASDDDDEENEITAVGAYVADPKRGRKQYVGAVDINSLYPSAIRTFNMGPETLFAQVLPTLTDPWVQGRMVNLKGVEVWHDKFAVLEMDEIWARSDQPLKLQLINGKIIDLTAEEVYSLVFESGKPLCISANGTIFKTDKTAVIPGLLARWYSQRKEMQAKKKEFDALYRAEKDPEKAKEYKAQAGHWDRMQQARKILLNATYGAILNPAMRYYDHRIGQSVTMTGRSIVRHMCSTINQIIVGEYDYKGAAVIYADTDSCYFSAYEAYKGTDLFNKFEWTKENVVKLYDRIADETNNTFNPFLLEKFNIPADRACIKAGRELVASTTVFSNKKRYAALIYDLEGVRTDFDKDGNPIPGKLKAMGLDLKRSDTPEYIQDFLKDVLMMALENKPDSEIITFVRDFRMEFRKRPGWEKGSPKAVNGLTLYREKLKGGLPSARVPGHVRASMAWNSLCDLNRDRHAMKINDGFKVKVCKLKEGVLEKVNSIAFPVDQQNIDRVDWFTRLPFDEDAMEETLIDRKLGNIIGVLNIDLTSTKVDKETADLFSF